MFWDFGSLHQKHRASAGHVDVCFVTGQMVGDCRSPRATILGVSFSASPVNHPVSVPPTGCVHRGAFTVYEMAGPVRSDGFTFRSAVHDVAASLWPAVVAAAKRPAPRGGLLVRCFWGARSRGSLTS